MRSKIRVAILDDHQSIIDGYMYRLSNSSDIEVVATMMVGETLETILTSTPVDVLLLDISLPNSPVDQSPYPVLHMLPRMLQAHPNLEVLVISMHAQRTLISAVMEAGASGYVLKDDQQAIHSLAAIVRSVASGGIFISDRAYELLKKPPTGILNQPLTSRQIQALSLCAAYPELTTEELAKKMEIANSTFRNLLSGAYLRLNVRSRSAAVVKANLNAYITPSAKDTDIRSFHHQE